MALRSLVLVDEKTMTRLDTGESVFGSDVQILNVPPVMMLVHEGQETIRMNHNGKTKTANAVLKHKRYTPQLCFGYYIYVRGL